MKKIIYCLLAFAAITLNSCQKDTTQLNNENTQSLISEYGLTPVSQVPAGITPTNLTNFDDAKSFLTEATKTFAKKYKGKLQKNVQGKYTLNYRSPSRIKSLSNEVAGSGSMSHGYYNVVASWEGYANVEVSDLTYSPSPANATLITTQKTHYTEGDVIIFGGNARWCFYLVLNGTEYYGMQYITYNGRIDTNENVENPYEYSFSVSSEPDNQSVDLKPLPISMMLNIPFIWDSEDYSGYGNNGMPNGISGIFSGTYTQNSVQLNRYRYWYGNPQVYNNVESDGLSKEGDFITVPNSPSLNPSGQITISAWIKPTDDFYDSYGHGCDRFISKSIGKPGDNYCYPFFQYGLNINANYYYGNLHQIGFGLTLNGLGYGVSSQDEAWVKDKWYYIVGTYNGSTMSLYINGVLKASQPASGTITQYNSDLMIGGSIADGYNNPLRTQCSVPGQYGNVRIYNYALTADEVSGLYSKGL